jgi:hypothetical protein
LAHDFQCILCKLGKLVQEQNAIIGQTDLTWFWNPSPSDQSDGGYGISDAGLDIKEFYSNRNDKRVNKKHIVYEISDRTPSFNEIWIKNTSCFARNTLSFEIIDKLRRKGVHVYFVEQNINTKDVEKDFLLNPFHFMTVSLIILHDFLVSV